MHHDMEQDDSHRCDDKETDDDDNEGEFLPGFTSFQDYSKVWHGMV